MTVSNDLSFNPTTPTNDLQGPTTSEAVELMSIFIAASPRNPALNPILTLKVQYGTSEGYRQINNLFRELIFPAMDCYKIYRILTEADQQLSFKDFFNTHRQKSSLSDPEIKK